MSGKSNEDLGAGCLLVIAGVAIAIGIGCLFGAGLGLISFGVMILALVLVSA